MEYWGIDLHAEYSQISILDEDGEVMEPSMVRTSRMALASVPGPEFRSFETIATELRTVMQRIEIPYRSNRKVGQGDWSHWAEARSV